MFGSKDKPEHPQQDPERSDDGKSGRKGLFGWMRRKGDDAPGAAPAQPPAPAEAVTEEKPADKPVATGSHDQSARQAAAELFSGLGQVPVPEPVEQPAEEPKGFFARMRAGLSKTSANLGEGMANLFLGEKEIDDELLEEMETRLLMADVGIEATTLIMESLQQRVRRRELPNRNALYRALQNELERLLTDVAKPLQVDAGKKPYVILVVGVNGVGKTTTIGKLAKRLQGEGKQVMLAAGDTFRAAAVEQLQVWGERNNIPVIAQHTGADSASVVFDALQAA